MKYSKIITFWIIHKEATYGIPINGKERHEIFKIIPFWIIHKELAHVIHVLLKASAKKIFLQTYKF